MLIQGPDIGKQQAKEAVTEALSTAVLLERYPKATIEVHCLVLECGGSEVAALLMAAGAAMIDARIDMRCLLSCAAVVSSPHFPSKRVQSKRIDLAVENHRDDYAVRDPSGCSAQHRSGIRVTHNCNGVQVTIGSHVLLDPSRTEADLADRQVVAAMDSARGRVANLSLRGNFSALELTDALDLAMEACEFYAAELRKAIEAHFARREAAATLPDM